MAGLIHLSLQDVHKIQMEAIQNHDLQKLNEAEELYLRMLEQDPDNWTILFFLGSIALHKGVHAVAIALLHRARQLKPDVLEIANNLGNAYHRLHLKGPAEQYLLEALNLGGDDADVLNNLGTLHINNGTPADGDQYFRRALRAKPDHAQAHWNLGLCLLEQEQWAEGFKEYAWGIVSKDRLSKDYTGADGYAAVWWDGKPHPEATLVVYGEQGIGDEIMFSSMLPELVPQFKKIVFDCHPRLDKLFQRSFPTLDCRPTRKEITGIMPWCTEYERLDYKIAIGNLGKFLRKRESDFPKRPYLKPDPVRVAEYREWLSHLPRPLIGLSWVGGHKKTRKDLRAILLENWLPIFRAAPGASFVSLQYTDQSWELKPLKEKHGITVHHFAEVFDAAYWESWTLGEQVWHNKLEAKAAAGDRWPQVVHATGPAYDYDDTIAFLQAFHEVGGIIVTVNTSLVHACGALGIPALVMTPSRPAWRYSLFRSDMAWYGPWIRQFRQTGDDWQPVIEAVAEEVARRLSNPQPVHPCTAALASLPSAKPMLKVVNG